MTSTLCCRPGKLHQQQPAPQHLTSAAGHMRCITPALGVSSRPAARVFAAASAAAAAPDPAAVKARIVAQFDRRAPSYEQANDYHPPLAAKLVQLAAPCKGEAVLDLACGTGLVAVMAAAAVGPSGRVTGVDLSSGMLEQARAKPQQPGAASVEWLQADVEELDVPPASLDVITCSAALPFVVGVPAALTRWRAWLRAPGGRLALNSFEAPAVADFGTFVSEAAAWGVDVQDPCERIGSAACLRSLLLAAGFSAVQVEPERKDRWYPAASVEEYAEGIYQQGVSNNPFSPVDEAALRGRLQEFHAACVAAIAARVVQEGRWRQGRGVRSPYTVLHTLAVV